MEYPKINTLFKRDAYSIIIPSEFTIPEFEYLKNNLFECTEKIDGTNIRVEIDWMAENEFTMVFKGRTDKAVIPKHLEEKLYEIFNDFSPCDVFTWKEPVKITLFGEGYGVKIQKGGNYIKNGVNFILFDIAIGSWWLERKSCEDIAQKLNIPIVPLIGYMTLPEAIEYVKNGFKSTISENKDYDAEGLVLKTPVGLLARNRERIITKLKTMDFVKFKAKYGDNPNPIQPKNEYY